MKSRILLAIVLPAIASLALLNGCSHGTGGRSNPEPPQAADPSAVILYGCGIKKTLRMEETSMMRLSSLLDKVAPLPTAANSIFIRFGDESPQHFFSLAQISPTNGPGNWVITNGIIIILAHTEQFPVDAMQNGK